jgi:hypothetical protein
MTGLLISHLGTVLPATTHIAHEHARLKIAYALNFDPIWPAGAH